MNKEENNSNKEYIATPEKKETFLEREERIKKEAEVKIEAKNKEYMELLEKKDDVEAEKSDIKESLDKALAANKALDKALWKERQKKEAGEYQAETEGQWISRRAVEILKNRCNEGRYGVKCSN